ncbi:MAG: 3-methyl-2-oxobutanoate hydroxymethyltransferase, partial [Nitrospirae bacterium]|nr:3-methyl-2-oxobutanoate hydroxymethyltransferase [Nitrospirota bacterium]
MARITINDFFKKKQNAEKIALITAYDYTFGRIVDEAGIDAILVGDSLSMVVQGFDTTLPVTMDEMIYHTKMVSRAAINAMVIGDMPFMSYQISIEDAVRNAGRFIKEGGAHAIKIEGGIEIVPQIKAIISAGIPVMGHIGLTPQSINIMGGFKVQGKTDEAKQLLIESAIKLEEAGCFSIVLEAVPVILTKQIIDTLKIPLIGIGAGPECDGQILVLHDVIGLFDRFTPKFVRRYAHLKPLAVSGVSAYIEDVKKG